MCERWRKKTKRVSYLYSVIGFISCHQHDRNNTKTLIKSTEKSVLKSHCAYTRSDGQAELVREMKTDFMLINKQILLDVL